MALLDVGRDWPFLSVETKRVVDIFPVPGIRSSSLEYFHMSMVSVKIPFVEVNHVSWLGESRWFVITPNFTYWILFLLEVKSSDAFSMFVRTYSATLWTLSWVAPSRSKSRELSCTSTLVCISWVTTRSKSFFFRDLWRLWHLALFISSKSNWHICILGPSPYMDRLLVVSLLWIFIGDLLTRRTEDRLARLVLVHLALPTVHHVEAN